MSERKLDAGSRRREGIGAYESVLMNSEIIACVSVGKRTVIGFSFIEYIGLTFVRIGCHS